MLLVVPWRPVVESRSTCTRSFSGQASYYKLKVPTVCSRRKAVTAVPRRVFSNAHAYHINSVSVNSDGESYLSADDLRINM